MRCQICNGTGKITGFLKEDSCKDCNGTGKITGFLKEDYVRFNSFTGKEMARITKDDEIIISSSLEDLEGLYNLHKRSGSTCYELIALYRLLAEIKQLRQKLIGQ